MTNSQNGISPEEIQKLINNQAARVEITKRSHFWFFNLYFNHYTSYPTARFQKKMFSLTEDQNIQTVGVVAFRGSAKSTIFTLSYPIWSILGIQEKKFVIILGQTQRQARQHLINIRRELESNQLLRADLGPFKEIEDEWGSYSLVIPKYGARITAASMEQTIRGMRHNQYRPDLIICDDIEDLQTVKTKEGRDKIDQWITGEVIPAGDKTTRTIFIGNLLHEDSMLMRIKAKIENDELDGEFLEVPLVDDNDKISWPGKFSSMEEIEELKRKIANESSWQREFLLRIISSNERVIHPEWIKHYDEVPKTSHEKNHFRFVGIGVDLAISQKESADYTAMVTGYVFGYEQDLKIYIMPNPVNRRMTHHETIETAKRLYDIAGPELKTKLFVEDVGYQRSVVQELERFKYPAESVKVHGQDKRSRLALVSHLIQNGTILFPKKGCEQLISQLTNFSVEKHDDLADAFAILNIKILEKDHKKHSIGFFSIGYDGEVSGCSFVVNKD